MKKTTYEYLSVRHHEKLDLSVFVQNRAGTANRSNSFQLNSVSATSSKIQLVILSEEKFWWGNYYRDANTRRIYFLGRISCVLYKKGNWLSISVVKLQACTKVQSMQRIMTRFVLFLLNRGCLNDLSFTQFLIANMPIL